MKQIEDRQKRSAYDTSWKWNNLMYFNKRNNKFYSQLKEIRNGLEIMKKGSFSISSSTPSDFSYKQMRPPRESFEFLMSFKERHLSYNNDIEAFEFTVCVDRWRKCFRRASALVKVTPTEKDDKNGYSFSIWVHPNKSQSHHHPFLHFSHRVHAIRDGHIMIFPIWISSSCESKNKVAMKR